MRFKCGLTQEEENLQRELAIHKLGVEIRYGKVVFAWRPIRIKKGDCRWLERVQRTIVGMTKTVSFYAGDYDEADWEFAEAVKENHKWPANWTDPKYRFNEKALAQRAYKTFGRRFIYKYEAIK